jgi:hypothetical protein
VPGGQRQRAAEQEDDELVRAQAEVQRDLEHEKGQQQPGRGHLPDPLGELGPRRPPGQGGPGRARAGRVAAPQAGQAGQGDQERHRVDQQRGAQQAGRGQQPGAARSQDQAELGGRLQQGVGRDQARAGEHVPHHQGQRRLGEHGDRAGREGQ